VKIPLFFKLTHTLAMRRISKEKCIDTYTAHKNFGKIVAKDRIVLLSEKYGIKKIGKKDSMANAYNRYKSRTRMVRAGLLDNKEKIKVVKDKMKDKVKDKKDQVKGKMEDKVGKMKDKIDEVKKNNK